ncbi:hypothetical protein AOLI_G00285900 [Acnodon oligacanthus]
MRGGQTADPVERPVGMVEYAINSLRSTANGRSPFEVSLGYQPPLFPEEEVDLEVPSVQAHIRRCRRAWCIARDALQMAQISAKRYADRRRRPGPGRAAVNLGLPQRST